MSIIKAAGAGEVSTGFFDHTIDQSLRINTADSAYLSRANVSGGSTNTMTFSSWVKRVAPGVYHLLWYGKNASSGRYDAIWIGQDDQIQVILDSTVSGYPQWSAKLRDPSAWYNIVVKFKLDESTDTDRIKLYINGVDQGAASNYPSSSATFSAWFVNSQTSYMGFDSGSTYGGGMMADVNVLDGVAAGPSSFGETKDGVWVPVDTSGLTFGANGFRLGFANTGTATTSEGTTATTNIGDDSSGQGHNFAVTNIVASDVVSDSPTNSFCTLNPLTHGTYPTLSEGNLKIASVWSADLSGVASTWFPTTGKWYWEVHNEGAASTYPYLGITDQRMVLTNSSGGSYYSVAWLRTGGSAAQTGTSTFMGTITKNDVTSWTNDDIIMFALDVDARKLWIGKNGTWDSSGDPAGGSGEDASWTVDTGVSPSFMGYSSQGVGCVFNFGQDGTFAGNQTAQGNADGNGVGDFYYSPPSGFLAMATSNIDNPTIGPGQDEQADDNFDTILYRGNGNELAVGTGGMRRPLDTISIAQSVIFDSASSPELYKTWSSDATDRKHFTVAFWVKRCSLGASQTMLQCDTSGGQATQITFDSNDKLNFNVAASGTGQRRLITTREFKDVRTFYHITLAYDSEASTASERTRIYVNGIEETSFDTDERSSIAGTDVHGIMENGQSVNTIGFRDHSGTSKNFLNGYLCDYHCIDGQTLEPTAFGQVGANGDWIPKAYSGSYGNNGFRLTFADSSAFGDDTSGNTNDFTAANLAATDKVIDSPTQNFATFDPTRSSGTTLTYSEGNLKAERTSTNFAQAYSNVVITEGKFYAEFYLDVGNSGVGVITGNTLPGSNKYLGQNSYTYAYDYSGRKVNNNSYTNYGDSYTTAADGSSDIVGVMINADDGEISFTKNGTVQNSGVPAFSGLTGPYRFAIASEGGIASGNCFHIANFGQDDSFNGLKTSGSAAAADGNGVGKFYDTPPTGFLALMDDNLPRKSGVISPDWVWIKERSNSTNHYVFDTVRGATKNLHTNTTDAEATDANSLLSFDSQGFTVGDNSDVNQNDTTYVGWVWKAGGSASSNSDGSNITSSVSANTAAGFSIVAYTGTGTGSHTVGHGLTQKPDLVIVKNRDADSSPNYWHVNHKDLAAADNNIFLNLTSTATDVNTNYGEGGIGLGDADVIDFVAGYSGANNVANANKSGSDYIAYCFHSVEGYSKIGKFSGNGSADGPFVFTGFRPAWVMIKQSSTAGNWNIMDNTRQTFNDADGGPVLRADVSNAEEEVNTMQGQIDILSNGFKVRANNSSFNASGATVLYMAFAEAPFKFANAR
jgi:hypothetical protein